MAAIVDPRHKSMEWLKRHQQHTIQEETSEVNVAAGADGLRRAVTGEFNAWLIVPEARPHGYANSPIDPLARWKMHDGQFPTIAKLARKNLAIPASSAPSDSGSERVFSRAKLIQQRQR